MGGVCASDEGETFIVLVANADAKRAVGDHQVYLLGAIGYSDDTRPEVFHRRDAAAMELAQPAVEPDAGQSAVCHPDDVGL